MNVTIDSDDGNNNRIQVFRTAEVGKVCSNPDGEAGKCGFVGEVQVAPQSAGGTGGSVNFSPDSAQSCMYVADLSNNTIYILNRENLQELDRVGRSGRQVGEFHWDHVVSVDSAGNLHTGEVDKPNRVQKFLRYGPTSCSGTGAAKVGEYR